MSELERKAVTPEELIRKLEDAVRKRRENKYASPVGLKDLEFELDEDKAEALGLTLPFQSVDQPEQALREGVITPTTFLENDDTEYRVMVFDPQPVGLSGFMTNVVHSVAPADRGLFEVGRYPVMNLVSRNRYLGCSLVCPQDLPCCSLKGVGARRTTSPELPAMREPIGRSVAKSASPR